MQEKVVKLYSEIDTALIAEKLASAVVSQKLYHLKIYLSGDLGVGKTTFSKYFLQALGVTENIKSPTYTIIESYAVGDFLVDHIDLYRIQEQELYDLGFLEEDHKIWLVEWPEKGGDSLPDADVLLSLKRDDVLEMVVLPKTMLGQQVVRRLDLESEL